MPNVLVGRKEEIKVLDECYRSQSAHFVAIYGRRRVGKTYLVKTVFKEQIFFTFTGLANSSLQRQITNFNVEISHQFSAQSDEYVTDWFSAFQLLRNKIFKSNIQKKVIFIDELPWLDTRNAHFVQALEHFWNGWANMRGDVLLIVCGSAASWMIKKLINNKGGLHNRVTRRLLIEPFTLAETEAFLKNLGAQYSRYQIVLLYMTFGGIPYYLEQINISQSEVQNINHLCFESNAFFKTEYDVLFSSLFNHSHRHQAVVAALAKKGSGMTRSEILAASKLDTGGTTTNILKELEDSSFIRSYPAYGKKEKDQVYQLIDFYSLFYLNHISKVTSSDSTYWIDNFNTSKYFAWAGYSFELVCMLHIPDIKIALGIHGIGSTAYSWRSGEAQIDLIIDRKDNVINLCEIKFSLGKYKMTKKYAEEIQNKVNSFISSGISKNKAVFPTIISTYGLDNSIHNGIFVNNITMEDIFYDM
ncbi:MAG: ATP-binding protein [Saprospiraceae bacterium]